LPGTQFRVGWSGGGSGGGGGGGSGGGGDDASGASAAVAAAGVDRFSDVAPINTRAEDDLWADNIIWDDRFVQEQEPEKVHLNLNDPGMLYFVKMPFRSRRFKIHQCKGRHRIPSWKLSRMQEALDIRGLNMFTNDPYNISNDRYYCPKQTDQKNEHALRTSYKRKGASSPSTYRPLCAVWGTTAPQPLPFPFPFPPSSRELVVPVYACRHRFPGHLHVTSFLPPCS